MSEVRAIENHHKVIVAPSVPRLRDMYGGAVRVDASDMHRCVYLNFDADAAEELAAQLIQAAALSREAYNHA